MATMTYADRNNLVSGSIDVDRHLVRRSTAIETAARYGGALARLVYESLPLNDP